MTAKEHLKFLERERCIAIIETLAVSDSESENYKQGFFVAIEQAINEIKDL